MFLYRLLLAIALPLLLMRLVWRVLRGQERLSDLNERLGGGADSPARAIWLHAASNGELASAKPLVEALLAQSHSAILITTNTVTARTLAQGWGLPRVSARLAPLDARWMLKRFLGRFRPEALIVVENELWPNRLTLTAQRAVPIIAVGARISARSARRWRKIGLGPRLMKSLTALSAQDAASEAEFRALGLPARNTLARLNLKTAIAAPPPRERLDWPRAATVLAASTHEGEEEIALAAFAKARALNPALRLIIAPRHPRRAPEVARAIEATGQPYAQRSKGEAPLQPVYLADTMGEMANWYASAGICLIGGTLAPKGGHTPFEPAAYGCALLHGPDIANHAEAFAALDTAGGAIQITPDTLADTLVSLDAARQAQMAQAATHALGALSTTDGATRLAQSVLGRIASAQG
ncbi:3-deoxy-D-manno-octulosonic acid transferase [Sinirhodobacter sp. HNIBRBA609]|nr:3-deoxy-D-manno-octulosonic acid transferase [Sinirhodobacter sp. HNIBRBA609]